VFLIAGVVAVIGAMALDVPKFYSLVRNAHCTTGTVVAKQPENHMLVQFKYEVNGEIHTSGGRAEDVGRSFDSVQIGDEVPVYYDTSHPASATMGDPNKYLSAGLRGTAFILIGLTVCFFMYILKRAF
jgi:hypothetical protein